MNHLLLLSLILGGWGLESTIAGLWWRWHQVQQEQQEQEEEERLTPYDSKDTVDSNEPIAASPASAAAGRRQRDPRLVGWEFKIVRCDREIFRDPAVLQALCEEEEGAGWILLEKLDDRRIRFKRPLAMREVIDPERLDFDPYRSYYGPQNHWRQVGLVGIVGLLALILPAYIAFAIVSSVQPQPAHRPPPSSHAP
jgi:hypothetical protein